MSSDTAALIIAADLIIWDEAPMMHKEALSTWTRRDVTRVDALFSGKVVILGDNFGQIAGLHSHPQGQQS